MQDYLTNQPSEHELDPVNSMAKSSQIHRSVIFEIVKQDYYLYKSTYLHSIVGEVKKPESKDIHDCSVPARTMVETVSRQNVITSS
jgi:hypothetical protein